MELIKYTSTLLKSKIPQFIRLNYPKFGIFLSHYFDYCDLTNQPNYFLNNIDAFRNIDSTSLNFIEHFSEMFLNKIPSNTVADINKRTLIKYIKDFYGSKGTEDSIKFLFRMLFDEEISIYYPTVDILRASDGRWGEEVSIKTTNVTTIDDISLFEGAVITGQTSGAKGLIERLFAYTASDTTPILEIFLMDYDILNPIANFETGETIIATTYDDSATITETIHECFTDYVITDDSKFYNLGDYIYAKPPGVDGLAIVGSIIKGSITGVTVIDGGSDYNPGDIINFISDYEEGSAKAVVKSTLAFKVTGSSNITFTNSTSNINDPIGGFGNYDVGDKILVTNTTNNNGIYTIATQNSTDLTVNESLVDESNTSAIIWVYYDVYIPFATLGAIYEIEMISEGHSYKNIPEISIVPQYPTGSDAILMPESDDIGSIKTSRLANHGVGYTEDEITVIADSIIRVPLISGAGYLIGEEVFGDVSGARGTVSRWTPIDNTITIHDPDSIGTGGILAVTVDTVGELITNGIFTLNIDDWTTFNSSWNAGKLNLVGDGVDRGYGWQAITCEIGKTYDVSVDMTNNSSGTHSYLINNISNPNVAYGSSLGGQDFTGSSGVFISSFTATDVTMYIILRTSVNALSDSDFDNVTIQLAAFSTSDVIEGETSGTTGDIYDINISTGIGTKGSNCLYTGLSKGTHGQLSSDKRLQDSYYYQDFSYVINTGYETSKWIDAIKNNTHPAGTIVFGSEDLKTLLPHAALSGIISPSLESTEYYKFIWADAPTSLVSENEIQSFSDVVIEHVVPYHASHIYTRVNSDYNIRITVKYNDGTVINYSGSNFPELFIYIEDANDELISINREPINSILLYKGSVIFNLSEMLDAYEATVYWGDRERTTIDINNTIHKTNKCFGSTITITP